MLGNEIINHLCEQCVVLFTERAGREEIVKGVCEHVLKLLAYPFLFCYMHFI